MIDARKLRDYALNPNHEAGRYKAAFFSEMGYNLNNWMQLEQDIREQHLSESAEEGKPSPYGQNFIITAPLRGPSGEARQVTTVWIYRPGRDVPELVTIEPATRRRE